MLDFHHRGGTRILSGQKVSRRARKRPVSLKSLIVLTLALGVSVAFRTGIRKDSADALELSGGGSGLVGSSYPLASLKIKSLNLKEDIGDVSGLAEVSLKFKPGGVPLVDSIPPYRSLYKGQVSGVGRGGELVIFTVKPELQSYLEKILDSSDSKNAAAVVMEPSSGRILAIHSKSSAIANMFLHSGFPAASIFKLVTAGAAFDRGVLTPDQKIRFRGGTYTLNRWNYKPDKRRDWRTMSVAEALGKSCNPAFGRIALNYLSPGLLAEYAKAFGFNASLSFDMPLKTSKALIPDDDYRLARAAAGFGKVFLSPVHAAAIVSGIASNGYLPRPALISKVLSKDGNSLYSFKPAVLSKMVSPGASRMLLKAMEETVKTGTCRKEFSRRDRYSMRGIKIAAKTGTLQGDNPKGLNNWFVAVAPGAAVAVVTVNPGRPRITAVRLGRMILKKMGTVPTAPI